MKFHGREAKVLPFPPMDGARQHPNGVREMPEYAVSGEIGDRLRWDIAMENFCHVVYARVSDHGNIEKARAWAFEQLKEMADEDLD